MDDKRREVVDEGYRSYFLNKGSLKNPYPKDSQSFFDFERGWVQALKQSPDTGPNLDFDDSMAAKYSEMGKRKATSKESTYNAYAEAKGK